MFNGSYEKRQADRIIAALPDESVELGLVESSYVAMARRGVAQILRYSGVMVGRYPDHEAVCFAERVGLEGFQRAMWSHMESCTVGKSAESVIYSK